MNVFAQGLIVGFSVAMPFGPVNLLVIQRTLRGGWLPGAMSGLGASTSDLIYAAAASFGLVLVSEILLAWNSWIQLAGALFIFYFGIQTLRYYAPTKVESKVIEHSTSNFFSAFVIAATSPMTITLFASAFAAIGITAIESDYGSAAILTMGVGLGCLIWDLSVASVTWLVRRRLTTTAIARVNLLGGLLLILFALIGIYQLYEKFNKQ